MKSLYQPEENVNPVSLDIDGLPFIDALEKTVEKKWGGILRVMKEDEQIGSVFMRDGQVAWAVSRNQTENFGSFLERIGLIPKEKLSEIVNRYKLRECLRAHIRAAIASMMNDPEVVIKASHGEMIVDSNLIFFLNEVLPKYCNADEPGDPRFFETEPPEKQDSAGDKVILIDMLGNLAVLPGYRYSFISEPGGNLLALHKSETDSDLEEAVASAIAWLNSAATHSADGHFGKMESIILEHEKGLLIAQSTDNERRCFINASFDKNGKLGVIKHKISELIPSIRQVIAEGVD
jgi:hypothetical protein